MTNEFRQKLEAAARLRLSMDPHADMCLRCDTILELLTTAPSATQGELPLDYAGIASDIPEAGAGPAETQTEA